MDEERVQFVTFTTTYTFIGDDVGGSVDYNQTLDVSNNTSITLSNITITKTQVPTSKPPEESPVYANDFVFTFSGFYGEEVAANDTYRARIGNEIVTYTSFNNLPNFNQANTYLVDFIPDPREEVTLLHYFTANTGTVTSANVVITLDGSRHLTRLTNIKNTLTARAESERLSILDRVRQAVQLTPEER